MDFSRMDSQFESVCEAARLAVLGASIVASVFYPVVLVLPVALALIMAPLVVVIGVVALALTYSAWASSISVPTYSDFLAVGAVAIALLFELCFWQTLETSAYHKQRVLETRTRTYFHVLPLASHAYYLRTTPTFNVLLRFGVGNAILSVCLKRHHVDEADTFLNRLSVLSYVYDSASRQTVKGIIQRHLG